MTTKKAVRTTSSKALPKKTDSDKIVIPIRFVLDTGGTWHAHQSPDANAEVVFSRKALTLTSINILGDFLPMPPIGDQDVRPARFILQPDLNNWQVFQTPDANAKITFSVKTGRLVAVMLVGGLTELNSAEKSK